MISRTEKSWIQKTPSICGGDACIRDTCIPVWSIIRPHQLGASALDMRTYFVTPLSADDILAALKYYGEHTEEIDSEIHLNEEA
jgi:uncharacterized protein (DUF433 family)